MSEIRVRFVRGIAPPKISVPIFAHDHNTRLDTGDRDCVVIHSAETRSIYWIEERCKTICILPLDF